MAWMRLEHSMPSASGKFMSMVTTAGLNSLYILTASAASLAIATTSKFVLARVLSSIARLTLESSTTITLTFSTKAHLLLYESASASIHWSLLAIFLDTFRYKGQKSLPAEIKFIQSSATKQKNSPPSLFMLGGESDIHLSSVPQAVVVSVSPSVSAGFGSLSTTLRPR